MGQKVHPVGFRLPHTAKWNANWYAEKKDIPSAIYRDYLIRKYINQKLSSALISDIIISQRKQYINVKVYLAKLGAAIGVKGGNITQINQDLSKLLNIGVQCNFVGVRSIDSNASIVAKNISLQLQKRANCRKAVLNAMQKAMKDHRVLGIRVVIAGRIGGAEMAKKSLFQEGRAPLHSISYKIAYCEEKCPTTFGVIGIKVYVCYKKQ